MRFCRRVGRRRPHTGPWFTSWSFQEFAGLLYREALYRIGEHPHLAARNLVWREDIRLMEDAEVLRRLTYYATAWPSRMVQP